MQGREENMVAVRQEILDLLRQQMEALNSPLGLTDARLTECYERQARVQELRERLEALAVESSTPNEVTETGSCPVQAMPASVDAAANV